MPNWQPLDAFNTTAEVLSWLSEKNSLTERCKVENSGSYFFELREELPEQRISAEDASYLNLSHDARVTVRDIIQGGNSVRVYGRSVLPAALLNDPVLNLKTLGTQALGQRLFAPDSPAIRGDIEVSEVGQDDKLGQDAKRYFASLRNTFFARRSRFTIQAGDNEGASLAVYEVFEFN